jgi:hypothetical protein
MSIISQSLLDMMTRELIRNFELLASVVVVAAAKQDGGLVKQGLSNWN